MAENAEPMSMVEALEFSRRVEDQNKKLHLIQPSIAATMGIGVLTDCEKQIGAALSDRQSLNPEASFANNKIEQVTTSYKNLSSSIFTPAKDTTALTEENEEKKNIGPKWDDLSTFVP